MTATHSLSPVAACLAAALPQVSAGPELHLEAVDAVVREEFERLSLPGAVVGVVSGDELVYQVALGQRDLESGAEMTTDTPFQIGSATKSMTAVLMGLLRDRGELDFEDTVRDHLPEGVEIPAELQSLTLAQLAAHTAGLPRDFVNRRDVPDTPSVAEPYSTRELLEGLQTTGLLFEPGSRGSYSNVGYALLGYVLESATGASYEELLVERLCRPLGMTSTIVQPTDEQERRLATHYWNRDDPPLARERWRFGEVAAHGGVVSSLPDLARYLRLQWSEDEEAPVSQATLAELRRPVIESEDGASLATGWFLYPIQGGPIVGHDGGVDGNSASLAFLPGRALGVIALTNRGGDTAPDLAKAALRAVVTGRY